MGDPKNIGLSQIAIVSSLRASSKPGRVRKVPKRSPAAMPGFALYRSPVIKRLRANLTAYGNAKAWLIHGDKMARRSNQLALSEGQGRV
jgi:hypothetical protein